MDQPIYLVGKHDICTVLSHFFKKSSVLVSPQPIKNLSSLIKEQIPENSITIIILSSDNKVEIPPAYQSGERVVSCLLLDTAEEANQWVAMQKSLSSQQKTNISILAQWNPHYLKLANSWLKALKTQPKINVNNWMADTVGKTRLLDYLQKNT